MEILVLHPGALGDLLLSLPALSLIAEHWTPSRLTLACSSDHFDLLKWTCVSRLIPFSTLPLHRLYFSEPPHESDIEPWCTYDRVISWTGFGNRDFADNFARIHPHVLIASWHPKPAETRHVSRLFVDSLAQWIPAPGEIAPVTLRPDTPSLISGREWLFQRCWHGDDVLIGIHPGAGGTIKRWPVDYFRRLIACLLKMRGAKILIIEGPAEPGLSAEVSRDLPSAHLIHAVGLPVHLLAAVLVNCRGFIGHDSGVTHLAGVLDVPSVALFGPTRPEHWAPLGSNVRVLRDARNCRACAGDAGSRHTCMESITPEPVVRALEAFLRSDQKPESRS